MHQSGTISHHYTVLVFSEDDAWVAFVPTPDIATQGGTQEHAVDMARDANTLWMGVARERGPHPYIRVL